MSYDFSALSPWGLDRTAGELFDAYKSKMREVLHQNVWRYVDANGGHPSSGRPVTEVRIPMLEVQIPMLEGGSRVRYDELLKCFDAEGGLIDELQIPMSEGEILFALTRLSQVETWAAAEQSPTHRDLRLRRSQ